MQLRYTFRFQQIGETWLGAAVGQNAHLFNGVLQLNEVGHFIVSRLAELTAREEIPAQAVTDRLIDALIHEYEVDPPTAKQAVTQVIHYLQNEGVLI